MALKVAVIGGSGFVGRHIVRRLIREFGAVINIDRQAPGEICQGERLIDFDISATTMDALVKSCGELDVIVWLAAAIRQVTTIDASAGEDLAMMVEAPLRFLAAQRKKPQKLVYISSVQVYGKPVYLPVDENHPTDPFTVYGVAKLCAENYMRIACRKSAVDFTALRLAFVYGPGQHAKNVIPVFFAKVLKSEPPLIHADGTEIRDDVFVEDIAEAVVKAIQSKKCGIYNIASGEPNTLLSVAEKICESSGASTAPVVGSGKSSWIDRWYSVAKAKNELQFEPTPLLKGLEKTWLTLK